MLTQICKSCGIEKSIEEFNKTTDRKSGRKTQCKECIWEKIKDDKSRKERVKKYGKNYHLKRRYGITEEQRNQLVKDQNHKCAICGIDEIDTKTGVLYVDHDHDTGKIRQMICFHCNTGLGHFKDSPEILVKALEYLSKHGKHKD